MSELGQLNTDRITKEPLSSDRVNAKEAYIRYLAGVAILNNPFDTIKLHNTEFDDKGIVRIAGTAEGLMLGGLRSIVRYANPPSLRSNLAALEPRHTEAAKEINNVVDRVFAEDGERIKELSPALWWLRPMPLRDEVVYKYICHSRFDKLKTTRLLDDLPAHGIFDEILDDRIAQRHK